MRDYSMHTDDELVLFLKQDQLGAFEAIYKRYWHKLFDLAYKRLHNTEICEEIVQEIFIRLWEKRFALVITTGFSNYLYTSVKYKVVDYYRKELIKDSYIAANLNKAEFDTTTEDNIFIKDLKKHLDGLISRLPPKCKQVYELSRLENKNNKEIAAILHISEKTVEGHLTKALHHIRLGVGDFMLLSVFFWLN